MTTRGGIKVVRRKITPCSGYADRRWQRKRRRSCKRTRWRSYRHSSSPIALQVSIEEAQVGLRGDDAVLSLAEAVAFVVE